MLTGNSRLSSALSPLTLYPVRQILTINPRFYAPWCGHCRNLQPAYEKAAQNLAGLAKVAAIDCDDEKNKAFCGSMGVEGFPTLKIVRPGKKVGRPNVENYQGPRNAKGIVEAVIDKIPNHVERIGDTAIDDWLKEENETAKAILFSNKGTTGPLLRSLAVDFLGAISFAQIRDKEQTSVALFGVSEFPTLIVLPGGTKDAIVYEGEMKKAPLLEFLSQITPPNPDPAPKQPQAPKVEKQKVMKGKAKSQENKAAFEEAATSHASDEASEAAAGATSIVLEDDMDPVATPSDAPATVAVPDLPPPIPTAMTLEELQKACLGPKAKTCIFALVPTTDDTDDTDVVPPEPANTALASLAEIAQKFAQRQATLFPLYAVPSTNPVTPLLRSTLALKDGSVDVLAINARRGWWRRFEGENYDFESMENWVDATRLGEGERKKLPEGIVMEEKETQEEEKKEEKTEDHDEL